MSLERAFAVGQKIREIPLCVSVAVLVVAIVVLFAVVAIVVLLVVVAVVVLLVGYM